MRQDTFRTRYVIKILSSVLVAALNMVIQLILPRALSVEQYGYYSYNLNVFSSVVVLANLSASNALIAKFAKRNEEIGLIYFYLKFYIVKFLCLTVGICVLYPIVFIQETFAGQTLMIVLLGLESALIMKLERDIIGIYDSMAISRIPAAVQIALKVFISIYVIAMFLLQLLNLVTFYAGQIFFTLIFTLLLIITILGYQRKQYKNKVVRKTREYIKEYYIFCSPLVLANIAAQVIVIVMNWALMKWSGATQQALFGAAWQLNTLVSYIFTPYAELSKREYAVGSIEEVNNIYLKSSRLMLWITAYFALFIGFCSDWFLPVIYGDKYNGATFITLLIMVYTVYQAWGQINGAVMLATEMTKLNAWLAIIGQAVTVVLVFIFQIPNFIWPSGLGAVGIAWVYAVGNLISTCIGVFLISKRLNLEVVKVLGIQIMPVCSCAVASFILNRMLNFFLPGISISMNISRILISWIIYTILMGGIVAVRPDLIGLSRNSLMTILHLKHKN